MLGRGQGLGATFGQGLMAALNTCSGHTYTLILHSLYLLHTHSNFHAHAHIDPSTKSMTLVPSEQFFFSPIRDVQSDAGGYLQDAHWVSPHSDDAAADGTAGCKTPQTHSLGSHAPAK